MVTGKSSGLLIITTQYYKHISRVRSCCWSSELVEPSFDIRLFRSALIHANNIRAFSDLIAFSLSNRSCFLHSLLSASASASPSPSPSFFVHKWPIMQALFFFRTKVLHRPKELALAQADYAVSWLFEKACRALCLWLLVCLSSSANWCFGADDREHIMQSELYPVNHILLVRHAIQDAIYAR